MNFKIWSAFTLFAIAGVAGAQTAQRDLTAKIGIDQKLGDQVPTDIPFADETGKTITTGDLFGKRPIILLPVFYTCQGVCGIEQDTLMKSLVKMRNINVGEQFDVVLVSINPKETPDLALAKKNIAIGLYRRPGTDNGFHYLTGSLTSIKRLTQSIGFRFTYDGDTIPDVPNVEEKYKATINHPAGLMVLTPEGKLSRYFYGAAEFPTIGLRDALLDAAQERIGPKAEVFLFGCIMVDPVTHKRTIVVENVLKVFGIASVLALAGMVGTFAIQERRKNRGSPPGTVNVPGKRT